MKAEILGRIYAAVRRIPRGRVATYGQIARLAGLPGRARQVGLALAQLKDGAGVPWHRVVNASGAISARGDRKGETLQRERLGREKVALGLGGRVPLKRFQWKAAADPGAESFRRLGGMR